MNDQIAAALVALGWRHWPCDGDNEINVSIDDPYNGMLLGCAAGDGFIELRCWDAGENEYTAISLQSPAVRAAITAIYRVMDEGDVA